MRGPTEEVFVMMWGTYNWGSPGFLLAAVFMGACVALMGKMMGHGRMSHHAHHAHGSDQQKPARSETAVDDQVLERRLVNGEIDIEEYYRLRDLLANTGNPASGNERMSD